MEDRRPNAKDKIQEIKARTQKIRDMWQKTYTGKQKNGGLKLGYVRQNTED